MNDSQLDSNRLWQDGSRLVVLDTDSRLPNRCVKCNTPDCSKSLTQRYKWKPPFPSFFQRKVTVTLYLCDPHFQMRRSKIHLGFALLPVSLLILFLAILPIKLVATFAPMFGLIGFILFVYSSFLSFGHFKVLSVVKIVDGKAWLKGGSKKFLSSLPEFDARPRLQL